MNVKDNQSDEWIREHCPALLLFARQWVPDLMDAEDVLHDAFIRFWNTRGSIADPMSYLYACVRSTALNFVRGNRRRQRREECVGLAQQPLPLLESTVEQNERNLFVQRQRPMMWVSLAVAGFGIILVVGLKNSTMPSPIILKPFVASQRTVKLNALQPTAWAYVSAFAQSPESLDQVLAQHGNLLLANASGNSSHAAAWKQKHE